jgi:ATP-dependent Lhr-like helicase
MALSRVSPLAVPVLLEVGKEGVHAGEGEEALLAETEALVAEAMEDAEPPVPRPRPVHPVHRANFARRERETRQRRLGL